MTNSPPERESTQESVAKLLAALQKLPRYRGVTFRGYDAAGTRYRDGEVVVSPVIIATTMDLRIATENFAHDSVLAIFGTEGRSIEAHSQHRHEREVVYLPSTVYRVGNTAQVDGLSVTYVEQLDLEREPSDPPWTTLDKVEALVAKHVPLARDRVDAEISSPGKFTGRLE